jgi:hypothetical protein
MRRIFLIGSHRLPGFALILAFGMVIAFTGCDNAAGPGGETAGSGALETLTISGPLALVEGAGDLRKSFAVLYQGNLWFVEGMSRFAASSELTEGAIVTVTGCAAPILDRDAEGNSLFLAYYLKAESLSVSG